VRRAVEGCMRPRRAATAALVVALAAGCGGLARPGSALDPGGPARVAGTHVYGPTPTGAGCPVPVRSCTTALLVVAPPPAGARPAVSRAEALPLLRHPWSRPSGRLELRQLGLAEVTVSGVYSGDTYRRDLRGMVGSDIGRPLPPIRAPFLAWVAVYRDTAQDFLAHCPMMRVRTGIPRQVVRLRPFAFAVIVDARTGFAQTWVQPNLDTALACGLRYPSPPRR
jgi:hypothetical protein